MKVIIGYCARVKLSGKDKPFWYSRNDYMRRLFISPEELIDVVFSYYTDETTHQVSKIEAFPVYVDDDPVAVLNFSNIG